MVGNGDDKQQIEYAEISKTIKKKAREDINKYDREVICETIVASKSLRKVRTTQKLAIGQDRLITLIDKQVREKSMIKIRIEEVYTELYDSEQSTIIHTDPKEVPDITSWQVEAALRDMNNRTAAGNDHNKIINIKTLKAGEDTISKTVGFRPHPRRKPTEGEVQRI